MMYLPDLTKESDITEERLMQQIASDYESGSLLSTLH